MPCREAGGQHTVHFFREGLRHVSGSQTGLDVGHRNFTVESRQRSGERGGGIALDHDQVGPFGFEHRFERGQDARRESGERLARLHQVEVVIRRDGEGFEGVVEHLAVLRRDADLDRELRRPQAQVAHQWTKLNGFRPGAEDGQDALRVRHSASVTSGAFTRRPSRRCATRVTVTSLAESSTMYTTRQSPARMRQWLL